MTLKKTTLALALSLPFAFASVANASNSLVQQATQEKAQQQQHNLQREAGLYKRRKNYKPRKPSYWLSVIVYRKRRISYLASSVITKIRSRVLKKRCVWKPVA